MPTPPQPSVPQQPFPQQPFPQQPAVPRPGPPHPGGPRAASSPLPPRPTSAEPAGYFAGVTVPARPEPAPFPPAGAAGRRRRGGYGRTTRVALGTVLVLLAALVWWVTNAPVGVGAAVGAGGNLATLLGRQAGLQLPAPVTRTECVRVLDRLGNRIGSSTARGDFLRACLAAQGSAGH